MGVHNVPSFIKNAVDSDMKPYIVAYHFKLDPDVVRSWDNEAIAKAYYSLIRLKVIQ